MWISDVGRKRKLRKGGYLSGKQEKNARKMINA